MTLNIYPNLNDQQFRLSRINEIKDYFIARIIERELMSNLNKYIASFDYFGKSLTVLSAISGSICIASFGTATGAPVGIASAIFSHVFLMSTGIIKKLFKTTRNKKKKHNKALIKNEISHEDFTTIINEEKKYRELKESIRMEKR